MRYSDRSHMVDGGSTECFCRDPQSHVVPLGAFAIPVGHSVDYNAPLNQEIVTELDHEQAMQRRRDYRWALAGIWGLRILFLCIFMLGFWTGYLVGVAGWGS